MRGLAMSSKNLMNQPIKLLTDRELHEIRKCGDLSLDELRAVNDELAARDLNLARHEKQQHYFQENFSTYEFRWWHFFLAVMVVRAIVKMAHSSP
jgi:hypothetical protein